MNNLTVISPPDGEALSLDAAKEYLRIGHAGEDGLVAELIAAARARLEAEMGLALVARTVKRRFDRWPSGVTRTGMRLMPGPASALVSVETVDAEGAAQLYTARFALMSWFFEESLAEFAPYKDEQVREGFQIIGTSGTVTTVAASHLGLKRYDRTKVDGLRMTSDQIDLVIRDYLSLGPEGRRRDPRIGQDRQTLIMSGAAILQALLRCWPTDRLSVADRGLREGLLYAQMSAHGVLEDAPY